MARGDVTSGDVSRRGFLKLGGMGLGALTLGSGLSACGQGGTSGGSSSGRKTINFVTAKFESSTSMKQFVQPFNKSQGKYEVVVRELPPPSSSTEVHQQLAQSLGSGSGIDVFTQDVIWVAEFASAGWAMDVSKEFSESDRSAFFSGLVDACTYDGKMYGIPFYLDAGQLYYRNDLLGGSAPPATWDDLTAMSQKLKGSGKVDIGFSWQGKQAEVLVCDLVEFVTSAGGSILGPDGKSVMIADSPAVAGVQYMYDTMNSLAISPKNVLSWDEEPSRQPFTSGKAAFLRQWSYVYGVSQDKSQSDVVGKVGVAPLPHFSGGQSAACLGGYQLAIAESSQNKDGALEFVRWMTEKKNQIDYAEKFGSAPSLQTAYDDPALEMAQPAMVNLKSTFQGGTPRPVTPKYPQVSLALQSAVSKALDTGDVKGQLANVKSQIEGIVGS